MAAINNGKAEKYYYYFLMDGSCQYILKQWIFKHFDPEILSGMHHKAVIRNKYNDLYLKKFITTFYNVS